MYLFEIIQKCAGVVRKCWTSFKGHPIEATLNTALIALSAGISGENFLYVIVGFSSMLDVFTAVVKVRRSDAEWKSGLMKKKIYDLIVFFGLLRLIQYLTFFNEYLVTLFYASGGFVVWVEMESIAENMRKANYRVEWLETILNAFKKTIDGILTRFTNKTNNE